MYSDDRYIIPGMEGNGVKVSRNALNSVLAINEQNFVRKLQKIARGYQITVTPPAFKVAMIGWVGKGRSVFTRARLTHSSFQENRAYGRARSIVPARGRGTREHGY